MASDEVIDYPQLTTGRLHPSDPRTDGHAGHSFLEMNTGVVAANENEKTPATRSPGSFWSHRSGLGENQVFFAPVPGMVAGTGGAGGASSVGGAAAGVAGAAGDAMGATVWGAGAVIVLDGICGVELPGITFEGVPGICEETAG
jgi:hypothetical protein